jgi:adenylylsulfate kinase/chloramphenicol 3-O phosphotransferase
MNKGRIIFLNGLTSCGKTSAAERMKELCGDVLYVVSNDIFHCMVDWKFFRQDYWKMVAHTITAQYYAARGMAEAGFSVVIDGMLLDLPAYREQFGESNADLVRRIFADLDVTYVDFRCSPEELRRRNVARGDRGEFQSDEQARLMTKDFDFDLVIDVINTMPDESAEQILTFCSLPFTHTSETDRSAAGSRGKILSSVFGSRGEITSLNHEKYANDGYPLELRMLLRDPGDDVTDELAARGYREASRTERVITFNRGNRERLRVLYQPDGDLMHTLSQLGKTVTVTADRPMNSVHPAHSDMIYPVNYGFVTGISSGDGEWMDAYILGVCEPLSEFCGVVSGVLHRFDDCDDKLIVTPPGTTLTSDEIREAVSFCEKHFDSMLFWHSK